MELLNSQFLDESVSKIYYSVDGEDGDEDNVEYENEENEVGGIEPQDSPRFRQLVRNKKLEFKAKYGKGHFKNESTKIKKCIKIGKKEVCTLVPHIKIVWVSGWRKKWKEFKKSGGLAQLKLQSKGQIIPQEQMNVGVNNTIDESNTQLVKPRLLGGIKMIQKIDTTNSLNDLKEESKDKDLSQNNEGESPVPRPIGKSKESSKFSDDDKFLGMPKNIGIAVVVVGAVAIVFGIYKFSKR